MRFLRFALVLAGMSIAIPAIAQTEDDTKEAGKLFVEGQRAFTTGDYRHSAESFEAAYQKVPKLPALWNAARAWHRAGEPVKAANLYAAYLDKAPAKAPDRASATKSMKELEAKLGRLEVHAAGFDSVTVDGAALAGSRLYVSPGAHLVEGHKGPKVARDTPNAQSGTTTSVVLVVPEDPPPAPVVVQPEPKPERKGISPVFVGVGGVLTGLGAGLVVWSGLETIGQRSTFDKFQTQSNLDDGRSMQTRTNVLVGITLGLAVVTGVTAIFTDWSGKKKESPQTTRLLLGPTCVGLEGSFQ